MLCFSSFFVVLLSKFGFFSSISQLNVKSSDYNYTKPSSEKHLIFILNVFFIDSIKTCLLYNLKKGLG